MRDCGDTGRPCRWSEVLLGGNTGYAGLNVAAGVVEIELKQAK